jgi:hypothetical protein
MTTFPGSPRILKGALVSFDLPDQTPNVIVFQYNPVTLTRSLDAQVTGGKEGRARPVRLKGAPVETISLEVEIDATDQLEKEEDTALQRGIHPQLAALEVLIYPKSADIISSQSMMSAGVIEIIPPLAAFTLLVYGPQRIVPVQVTNLNITEEAHDVNLNPTRAKVSLSLRVLSYNDLLSDHPGHALFMAYQVAKETMAKKETIRNLDAVVGSNVKLL